MRIVKLPRFFVFCNFLFYYHLVRSTDHSNFNSDPQPYPNFFLIAIFVSFGDQTKLLLKLYINYLFHAVPSATVPILFITWLTPTLYSNLKCHLLQEAFLYSLFLLFLLDSSPILCLISIRALGIFQRNYLYRLVGKESQVLTLPSEMHFALDQ